MGQQAALVTTWRTPVPGREKQAIECFMDYLTHVSKQAAEGRTSEPESYFKYDGSGGMGVVRGQSDVLLELWESDDFRDILSRAQLTVQDIYTEMYAAGDTVQDEVGRFSQHATSMGYM
jgi:hypothetical protein